MAHAGPAHHPRALDPQRSGDDRDRADPPRAALFKKQRNVEDAHRAGAVPRQESLLRAADRGLDDRPQSRAFWRLTENAGPEFLAIDAARYGGAGEARLDRRKQRAARPFPPMTPARGATT